MKEQAQTSATLDWTVNFIEEESNENIVKAQTIMNGKIFEIDVFALTEDEFAQITK